MRFFVRFWVVFAMSAFAGTGAMAEGPVTVRTGDHDQYSRIVFEWKKLGGYKVETPDPKSIIVRFDEAGTLPKETVEAFNVIGFEVLSTTPLTTKITIPQNSESRSFAAGDKVIVDIYDSPDRARPPPPTPEPGSKEEKKKETDEPELGKIIKPDTRPIEQVVEKKEPEKEAAAIAPEVKTLEPKHEVKNEKPVLIPKDNLISISATKAFGMAQFESGGRIVMVVDDPGIIIKPQVSGDNADLVLPVEAFDIDKAKGYHAASLPGTKLAADGGGLLWSAIITPDTEDLENAAIENRGKSVFIPLKNIRKSFTFVDPVTQVDLMVFTVADSESPVGEARSFIDFDILPSAAGVAIRPKVDGLEAKIVTGGVEITKPGGLVLTAPEIVKNATEEMRKIEEAAANVKAKPAEDGQVLFDFKEWRMGGLEGLNENRNLMFSAMHDKPKEAQIEDLITLARMHISNGRGAEALGFLRFAAQELPELEQNPAFLALRAVAKAFDGKLETALEDLSSPILDEYGETKIWKAYVLAGLGDWAQAAETLPADVSVLKNYTPEILNRLCLVLAEIQLRDGNIEVASELFKLIESGKEEDHLNKAIDAQMVYLKGEAARQQGKTDETIKLWEPLTIGPDDLYRVKTGLSLTRLLIDEKKLSPKEAIDKLERLRYAWRGDDLEAQVNYWLGRTYFEAGETIKGLKILRDALPIAKDTPLAPKIAQEMVALYTGYFNAPAFEKENPLDAVALYEEFNTLLPEGEVGNKVMKALAERLVKADLLSRGAALLQSQLDKRLQGDEAARTAVRLSAIYLLDKEHDKALKSLEKALSVLKTLPADIATPERIREIELLRARALSQAKKPDQALSVLASMTQGVDVHRLRADIAWQAGYWDDASYALKDVIDDEDIKLTRPLTDPQAAILLQRALALNLSGDRIGLANMREKYTEAMSQTSKAKQFEVVTRARQSAGLADRDTLLSAVSEVDLFKGFLESYKKDVPASN